LNAWHTKRRIDVSNFFLCLCALVNSFIKISSSLEPYAKPV
jgi:hypothetical protein